MAAHKDASPKVKHRRVRVTSRPVETEISIPRRHSPSYLHSVTMARRKTAGAVSDSSEKTVSLDEPTISTNGTAEEPPEASKQATPPAQITYDPVQINNYNITELKNTLDDALKRVCLLGFRDSDWHASSLGALPRCFRDQITTLKTIRTPM